MCKLTQSLEHWVPDWAKGGWIINKLPPDTKYVQCAHLLLHTGGSILKLAVKSASPSGHLGTTRIPGDNWSSICFLLFDAKLFVRHITVPNLGSTTKILGKTYHRLSFDAKLFFSRMVPNLGTTTRRIPGDNWSLIIVGNRHKKSNHQTKPRFHFQHKNTRRKIFIDYYLTQKFFFTRMVPNLGPTRWLIDYFWQSAKNNLSVEPSYHQYHTIIPNQQRVIVICWDNIFVNHLCFVIVIVIDIVSDLVNHEDSKTLPGENLLQLTKTANHVVIASCSNKRVKQIF